MANIKLNFGDVVMIKNINQQQKEFFESRMYDSTRNIPNVHELQNWGRHYSGWLGCKKITDLLKNC